MRACSQVPMNFRFVLHANSCASLRRAFCGLLGTILILHTLAVIHSISRQSDEQTGCALRSGREFRTSRSTLERPLCLSCRILAGTLTGQPGATVFSTTARAMPPHVRHG